jgi:hypothetical protein
MAFICPVCGYPDLEREPHPKVGGSSDEICPSCHFQFGFTDDDRGFAYDVWRSQWIDEGMPWRCPSIASPPKGWDPRQQLKNLEKGELKE